jgi:hypothetical protein
MSYFWALLGLHAALSSAVEYRPVAFYRFENMHPGGAADDSSGRNISLVIDNKSSTAVFPCPSLHGPVGGYLEFNAATCISNKTHQPHLSAKHPKRWGAVSKVNMQKAKGFTVEFLFKPLDGFLRGGESWLFEVGLGGEGTVPKGLKPLFIITYNALTFYSYTDSVPGKSAGSPQDSITVHLTGQGVRASDYFWRERPAHGGWHHIVLVKDAETGEQSVWIDGNCTAEMRTPGNATGRVMTPISTMVIDVRNPVALAAAIDEIAIYDTALPASMIYTHFLDSLVHHQPYSTSDPGLPVPPPTPYPHSNETAYYNLEEYAIGTQLPSPDGDNNTVGAGMTCVDQMNVVAGPRFNESAIKQYGTPYNFNWMDPHYMAGATNPSLKRFNANLTIELQVGSKCSQCRQRSRSLHNSSLAVAYCLPFMYALGCHPPGRYGCTVAVWN